MPTVHVLAHPALHPVMERLGGSEHLTLHAWDTLEALYQAMLRDAGLGAALFPADLVQDADAFAPLEALRSDPNLLWVTAHLTPGAEPAFEIHFQGLTLCPSAAPLDEQLVALMERNAALRDLHTSAERLAAQEQAYRSLTEHSEDMIMRFDPEMRHVYANAASSTILGIPQEDFIGRSHHELGFPEEAYTFWESQIRLVFETGQLLRQVVPLGESWYDWSLIPEHDADGAVQYVLSYSRNITPTKQAELLAEEKKRRLKLLNDLLSQNEHTLSEALKAKNRMMSILAHDLRGPLSGMASYVRLVLEDRDTLPVPELVEALETVLQQADQTYALLENLLGWIQSQYVAHTPQPIRLVVRDAFEVAMALYRETARVKRIHFVPEASAQEVVWADPYMTSAVLRNLLNNALKFSPPERKVRLSAQSEGGMMRISVADEGVGMTPERIAALFNGSSTFSTLGTHGEKGAGLGLRLSKEFVERMGGHLTVESTPGIGTTFSFTLPAAPEA